jgi:dTDP-4-amino-4,6-dideoxygalactose transaminase
MATGGAIARTGARPVFADIDPASFNLDPSRAEAAITSRTRAILPVDLYGLAADWSRFEALAAGRGLFLLEDAAQAMGARFGGRAAGSFGDASAFSFYPTKNLGGMGDGGLVTTRSGTLAAKIRLLRSHGDSGGYEHREIGMNSRLDAFQAAVLRVKLARVDAWNAERRQLASEYTRRLLDLFPGAVDAPTTTTPDSPLVPPVSPPPGSTHVYHQFVVRAHRRADLVAHLRARGVGCAVYYPKPLHLQECFAGLGQGRGSFPESERAASEVLALPIFPGLRGSEQDEVCEALAAFYGGEGTAR